ncbi:peptidoglycan recognition protein family protein [Kibdelosporangium phytohabitans]|uniref:N-acetylmuramoyl-L-alanine amidase domain-containing protein n=1 Tax=Kibdelosporangium phytohabitans TaxID=860235 RepID=A0A0N9HXP1_9PSEU|nr:N-acetylmuramoyl-L-alanine amidase [Kibdelosporangium phytohabitans]ALG06861.1 hypothetical protein AOZ06_07870 [Kibdelosporangium phytohabitans]MBE1468108.1 hypothetical protein [Kibdelosporangium phytohabitans]
MAWCPFAIHKPISKSRSRIVPRAVILHTAVSSASSLFGYFSGVGDDSHFYVGPNGELEQYVDTAWSAYANRDANGFAISFESWDNRQIIPWNAAQVETLVRAVDWCCTTHGIPRRQIPSATGSGLGWHAMWGAPSPWTKAAGKVCPGGPRIDQTRNIIIPRVAAGNVGMEADMTGEEHDWLAQVKGVLGDAFDPSTGANAGKRLRTIDERAQRMEAKLDALTGALSDDEANIIAAVRAQPTGGQVDVQALAALLAPLIPTGTTPEQITEAVRLAFARAGAKEGNPA